MSFFSTASRISRRLWTNYQELLDRRPLQTQIATTAVLWTVGDFSAQRIEGSKDLRRTALTAGYAASFIGPTGHYWYLGLDSVVVRLGLASTSLAGVASKVVADTLIYGPVHIVAFFAFMEAVEGRGLGAAADKIRSEFWPTFLVELGFWPAFQALNFWKVPVQHQLLAVNAACVLDSTFLCWARGQERWSESLMQKLGIAMPSSSGSSSFSSSSAPSPEDVTNDSPAKLKKGT